VTEYRAEISLVLGWLLIVAALWVWRWPVGLGVLGVGFLVAGVVDGMSKPAVKE